MDDIPHIPARRRAGAPRRTQQARKDATRSALLQAARACFGRDGYHATSTNDVVAAASVTRGALYHHFADKEGLFAALAHQVAEDLSRTAAAAALAFQGSILERLTYGMQTYLQLIAAHAEAPRILLVDGPAVLGWQRWRGIQLDVVLPGTIYGLQLLMDTGTMPAGPPEPLAHLLLAALNDAAMQIAHAPSPELVRGPVTDALMRLITGLTR